MRKVFAFLAAIVLATTTLGVGSAWADDRPRVGEQTPGIKWFSPIVLVKKSNPDQAVVLVRYRCEGYGIHLWASVKQGPQVNSYVPTEERPSPPADIARAWYETPEGPVPVCNGEANTLAYTISRATEGSPGHPDPWQRLRNGRGWAQFVVFSVPEGTNPSAPGVVPDREAFAGWVHVVKLERHHSR